MIFLNDKNQRCVNVGGAARLRGVSAMAISRAIARGDLRATRVGNMLLIRLGDAQRYEPDPAKQRAGRASAAVKRQLTSRTTRRYARLQKQTS